jgi:hypothetical protein
LRRASTSWNCVGRKAASDWCSGWCAGERGLSLSCGHPHGCLCLSVRRRGAYMVALRHSWLQRRRGEGGTGRPTLRRAKGRARMAIGSVRRWGGAAERHGRGPLTLGGLSGKAILLTRC